MSVLSQLLHSMPNSVKEVWLAGIAHNPLMVGRSWAKPCNICQGLTIAIEFAMSFHNHSIVTKYSGPYDLRIQS